MFCSLENSRQCLVNVDTFNAIRRKPYRCRVPRHLINNVTTPQSAAAHFVVRHIVFS